MSAPPGWVPRDPHLPPPGWLPDPHHLDTERYWNGQAWTDRTRLVGSLKESKPAPHKKPPVVYVKAKRRRGGAGAFLLTLVILLALAAGAGAAYSGLLPSWVGWPQEWTAHAQVEVVDYPVFGSNELVVFLATSMVAQEEVINVTFAAPGMDAESEALTDAMREAMAQNPYVFVNGWVVKTNGIITTITPEYTYDDAEAERRREATEAALGELVVASGALTAPSQEDAIALLHDQIVLQASYDWDAYEAINAGATSGAVVDSSQEAYGILVDGTAVCTGYAKTMLLAADALNIKAVVVTGFVDNGLTTGGHAWNRVLVDGQWKVVDVTWDDVQTTTGAEALRRDYLLLDLNDPLLASRQTDGEWVVDDNEELFE